ncbi:MAG: hypothetical protein FJY85_10090 [Deltaproteobacteria bacterium]|nr:hypothetical protein [Deltaproteobacteria bacterium]
MLETENAVYAVEDPDVLKVLEKHGAGCVDLFDKDYKNGANIAERALHLGVEGKKLIMVITDQKWLPLFYAARAGCRAVALIAPFESGLRTSRTPCQKLKVKELTGVLRGFKGWYYQPGDPIPAPNVLTEAEVKAKQKAKQKILKGFKELGLFEEVSNPTEGAA